MKYKDVTRVRNSVSLRTLGTHAPYQYHNKHTRTYR